MTPAAVKKRAARSLRSALARMNDSGRHWVKGAYQKQEDKELKFCSIGALRYAKLKDETMQAATIALADQIDPVSMAKHRAYVNASKISSGESWARYELFHRAQDIVIRHNDAGGTRWTDIKRVFTGAAESLESDGS